MRYFIAIIALIGCLSGQAQQINAGLNGDFEIRDNSVGSQGIDDGCQNVIDHALNWHHTCNSPDYIDPSVDCLSLPPSVAIAHTGSGLGRFVAAAGSSEFCHTQTGNLVAGTTYRISFWIMREASSQPISTVGVTVSPNPPVVTTNPMYTTSVDPILSFKPVANDQYVQYNVCYTATVSGMHYFGIGPHGGMNQTSPDDNSGFFIDDLEVWELDNSAAFPTAEITTAQSSYCVDDEVLLDASGCTNLDSYSWEITNENPNSSFVYQSGILTGNPGVLNFSSLVPNPQRGDCYKAVLQVYGTCTVNAEIEFCFENPTIPYVYVGAACANQPLDIVIDGDDGWTYTWSQGATQLGSGVGLQQITVSPSIGSTYYHVDFTTPEGCTGSRNILVSASDPTNLPPTMNGVNGTGEYTYYVQQGDLASFTSLLSNDHGNGVEYLTTSISSTLPPSAYVNAPGAFGDDLVFSWQTDYATSLGEYDYIFIAKDNNACDPGVDTFKFKIIVICNYCPVCIDYEARIPNDHPLPSESNAGQCIKLGLTETTQTGSATIVYHAGEYFEFGDFFEAGPGFEAIIAPGTCTTNCDDCCSNWEGFSVDYPYPNILLPDQGSNWTLSDLNHPYCAFGATGFELYIVDRWGVPIYQKIDFPGVKCCPYNSYDNTETAISWDGSINVGAFGQGNTAVDGVYYWVVYLHGCGQTTELAGNMQLFHQTQIAESGNNNVQNSVDPVLNNSINNVLVADNGLPIDHFYVFPNPTKDFVRVHSGKRIKAVFVVDDRGQILTEQNSNFDQPISLSDFSAGRYRIQASFEDGTTDEKTIVKE